MTEIFEPIIVGFTCNWCSYRAADAAGTARTKYPPNIRLIRLMCSGRLDPTFVFKAFANGADGVMVAGCHPGDCHYLSGNYYARRKLTLLHSLLDHMGVEKGRVQFSWVSASESIKFAQVITEVTESVRALGPRNKLVKASLKK